MKQALIVTSMKGQITDEQKDQLRTLMEGRVAFIEVADGFPFPEMRVFPAESDFPPIPPLMRFDTEPVQFLKGL